MSAASRYRFALRPKWIISHLFVLALVVAMIAAMFWQIDRLHQKQARNRRVVARGEQPVVPVESLAKPGDPYALGGQLEFRRVSATGRYLADQEVIVRSRSDDGAPGSWVLTPMELGNGETVVINRGWINNSGGIDAVPKAYRAPSGQVTVTGLVRASETRGRFGSRDPKTGQLTSLARADIDRLDQQVPEQLLPFFVQLLEQQPAVTDQDPKPVPKPELDEGPHLSYAIQWAIFTTVALVGYPLILRRRAREIERGDDDHDPDGPPPPDPTLDQPTPVGA